MKIWGRANSVNVKKVLWCAAELGLSFEHVNAGGAHGVVNEPAYRALNPNGVVPCLEDGDLVLWESNAIVRYLAARYGAGSLYLADPAARAVGDKWMDWATSSFAMPFREVFWHLVRTAPEQRDMALVERSRATCAGLLERVDAALAQTPYLSGAAFGMGDIPLGCFAYGWFEMPIDRPDLPHLADWYARVSARPAYRATVAIPLT